MADDIEDVLLRLLTALGSSVETDVLGAGILRELHYRVLVGPQGGAMIAALQQKGKSGKIIQSLAWLRENYGLEIAVADLAREVGMPHSLAVARKVAHSKTSVLTLFVIRT